MKMAEQETEFGSGVVAAVGCACDTDVAWVQEVQEAVTGHVEEAESAPGLVERESEREEGPVACDLGMDQEEED